MPLPNEDFHEIWWIYSPHNGVEWAGLRIAHFRKPINSDEPFVIIEAEIDKRRFGPRDWKMLQEVEHWYKVQQIDIPTQAQILGAAITNEGDFAID